MMQAMRRRKKQARRALPRKLYAATKDGDLVGGYRSAADEARTPDRRLSVCTLNVAGMDEIKLDMVLQHMESYAIDVMVCIDVQLSVKSGRFLGRKAKTRLGTGSVVHVTPCATYDDAHSGAGTFRKVGGIMMIVGCRWGLAFGASPQTGSVRRGPQLVFWPDSPYAQRTVMFAL